MRGRAGPLSRNAEPIEYAKALEFLSYCLAAFHGKKALILIDEYDVPLENAWENGFYERMLGFIRSLFESALKTNPSLEFAVITGCLRISRESIFTGLNNLEVHSLMSGRYGDSFGFTEAEVRRMLSDYGLEDRVCEVKAWYDGYQIGGQEIYNPWSIVNYIRGAMAGEPFPKAYWSNTSSNSIVKELVENADFEARNEIEHLLSGGSIETPVYEDVTYDTVKQSKDSLWNFL